MDRLEKEIPTFEIIMFSFCSFYLLYDTSNWNILMATCWCFWTFPQNRAQNKNELKPPPKKCDKIYPTLRSKTVRHWIVTCSNEEYPPWSIPEANSWHLKTVEWNTNFLLGWPIFRGKLIVSGSLHQNSLICLNAFLECVWHPNSELPCKTHLGGPPKHQGFVQGTLKDTTVALVSKRCSKSKHVGHWDPFLRMSRYFFHQLYQSTHWHRWNSVNEHAIYSKDVQMHPNIDLPCTCHGKTRKKHAYQMHCLQLRRLQCCDQGVVNDGVWHNGMLLSDMNGLEAEKTSWSRRGWNCPIVQHQLNNIWSLTLSFKDHPWKH